VDFMETESDYLLVLFCVFFFDRLVGLGVDTGFVFRRRNCVDFFHESEREGALQVRLGMLSCVAKLFHSDWFDDARLL
jgi:hypothetical protein